MAIQSVLQRSYSLHEFARLNDIALTTVRGEIKSGRLVARRVGRRTIITPEDANDWQAAIDAPALFDGRPEGWLHRDCQAGWAADRDPDIPSYLDGRGAHS